MGNKAAVAVNKLSKDIHESEERIKKEIFDQNYYCKEAVTDKNNFAARVLKLNEELQAISAEFQTSRKTWKSEKDELQSQILAERKEREDMSLQKERDLLQCRTENFQLEDQLSILAAAKMFLDEENKSLQNEIDRKALVPKENELNLERKIKELEVTLESVENDRDSFRASTMEKRNIIVDLQHKLSETEEENRSLLRDLNKIKLVSEVHACQIRDLENKNRELESSLQSVSTDLKEKDVQLRLLKSKDVQLRHLKSRRPLFQLSVSQDGEENCLCERAKSKGDLDKSYGHGRENGKENCLCQRQKSNGVVINRETARRLLEKRTPTNSVDERTTPVTPMVENQTTKSRVPVKRTPTNSVDEGTTPETPMMDKQTTKSQMPLKQTPTNSVGERTTPETPMVERQTPRSRVPVRRTPQQTASEKQKPAWVY